MQISNKSIQEFKRIYKKSYGKDLSDSEARESAQGLLMFCQIAIDGYIDDKKKQAKLKMYPKGFHYEDSKIYSCLMCKANICNEEVWYDKYGQKCLDCQDNLDKKRIPKMAFKDRDTWYSYISLEYDFGIKKKDVNRLIKEGKLIKRDFVNRIGNSYFSIFMKKDNPMLRSL